MSMGMGKERADLGFADELDGFDPADWTPRTQARAGGDVSAGAESRQEARQEARQDLRQARKIAEASGFRSREAPAARDGGAGSGEPLRRRRTGRNAQFNLKARPDTIQAFCAIADRQGWGLGETLEHAVALLERACAAQDPSG